MNKIERLPKIYKIGLRYPALVLVLCTIFSVLAFFWAKNLKIETDFSELLPPQKESVQNLKKLNENFGSMGHLLVTVESEDPSISEKFAEDFVERIERLPGVRYVDFRKPVEFFKKRQWLYVDLEDLQEMERRVDRSLELQEKGVSPVFSGLMDFADEEDRPDLTFKDIRKKYEKRLKGEASGLSSDEEGKFIVLKVKANQGAEDIESNRALISSIRHLEEKLKKEKIFRSVKVGYTGGYQASIETEDLIRKEMTWVSVIVSLILIFILILYFRRFSGAMLVAIPLAMGILWTGGFVYLVLGHVNVVTAFAVSILAGLGSDYGIYLLSRFAKEKDLGKDFLTACRLAFGITGKATFIAMLTTIGAFGALMFSGFEVFVEFGVVGCLGLLLNYLAMMLVMPSLLKLSDRYQNKILLWLIGWKQNKRIQSSWVSLLSAKIFKPKWAGTFVLFALLLCGISSLSLPSQSKIYFEDGQLDNKNLPSNQLYDRVSKTLKTSFYPSVFIAKGAESERRVYEEMTRQLKEESKESRVFANVIGISEFIPKNQTQKRDLLARLKKKYRMNRYINEGQKDKFIKSIDEVFKSKEITEEVLPEEVRRAFISPQNKDVYAIYVYPAIGLGSSENMKRYRQGIASSIKKARVDVIPVDGAFISIDIIEMITREAPRGLTVVLLFFSGVLFVTLRKPKRAFLILGNLLGGLLFISGVLYLTGIRLNILNIAVFPIILGTGIDCFIHFSHRYDENRDLDDAIRNEIPPILISNLTSIVGFGGLLLTSSLGLRSIGWVCVIGLVIITFFCTFIFPRCLLLPSLRRLKVPKVDQEVVEA